MSLDLKAIEEKWRQKWDEAELFNADPDSSREKQMVTFPFPYMNGPLHIGHAFTATRVDMYARYKRMGGYNVLFPWAWHWTGETIAGAARRVEIGDQQLIKSFVEIDGVPPEEVKKFVDPYYMALYYTRENRKSIKLMGFSIDWRREFHTTSYHPTFSRFVEWQYKKLRELGYVERGTHPVIWCPHCESPTGEADRLSGEDVIPEEYTLMKFKFSDAYLMCATLRPETIYAVTNLWANPDATYVKAKVNGETWIISEEASEKLKEQLRKVEILEKFKGEKLIGKTCTDLINNRELLILPGWFVDPKNASGLVYSVPAHAPYDWVALRDLQQDPKRAEKYGIKEKDLNRIKPISLIKIEEAGEYPAIELVDKMEIKDQTDPKVDEASRILYKKEYHTGILKDICGKYSGKNVSEVKEKIIKELRKKGVADVMYDLPEPVICRCTTSCIVKILKDQWFLKYSDKKWKEKTIKAISNMKICPETAYQWFRDVIDWYKDKACARKTGLGTPLPWMPNWIVETLSDSTIYMAFYTISKHVNALQIKPEQLTDEVFDYIFYGKGDLKEISTKTDLEATVIEAMRKEFIYWYPVDFRNSAKELLPNHLTFFVFQHVALFPEKLWPKQICVNGMLMIEGKKMSKSKGNFITLRNAVKKYSTDVTRCALMLAAENMDDADWREENVKSVQNRLEALYRLAVQISSNSSKKGEGSHLEKWLLSVLQDNIKIVTANVENLKNRTALENALYKVWDEIRWYQRRTEKPNFETLKEALNIWIRLLTPFIPHLCEEIWSIMGNKGFVSTTKWPTFDAKKVDAKAEETENLIKKLLEDTTNIIRALNITPKTVCYYTPASWKWKVYVEALKLANAEQLNLNNLIRTTLENPELKKFAKEIPKLVNKIVEEINRTSTEVTEMRLEAGLLNDFDALNDSKKFIEKELGVTVHVFQEDDLYKKDPKNRAKTAEPYRPAIYLE